MDCAIIGAGIAGLGACIALRRAGHKVEIFEKSKFRSEIGAAVTITPNGNTVLEGWGFDHDKALDTAKLSNRRLKPDTLEKIVDLDLSHVTQEYGHRFNAFHRVDLHATLRAMAESTTLPGSIICNLGTEVMKIDCASATLTLKDGTTVKKDLIIIADGIKSSFVKDINDTDNKRQFTGLSVHRTLIEMDKLMNDELFSPLIKNEKSGFCNTVNPKNGVMVVTYPCRRDKWMNVAVFHKSLAGEKGDDDWNAQADIGDVLTLLEDGFHPAWASMVRCAEPGAWKCFPVSKRDPMNRLVKGRVCIIGDAAHACLPTHGQGASMALEDAATLEVLFSNMIDKDVDKRLKLFEQIRLPRVVVTQLLSNAMMYNLSGDEVVDRVREYYDGPLPVGRENFTKPVFDFFYTYDIYSESRKALQYLDTPGGLPPGVLKYFGLILD